MFYHGQAACTSSKAELFLQLNITARSAAVSPGTADALETFQGVYEIHHVGTSKKLARLELSIVMCDGESALRCVPGVLRDSGSSVMCVVLLTSCALLSPWCPTTSSLSGGGDAYMPPGAGDT